MSDRVRELRFLSMVVLLGACSGETEQPASGAEGAGDPDSGVAGDAAEASSLPAHIDPDRFFAFREPDFDVEPGDEFTYCYLFPIPKEHQHPDPQYLVGVESYTPVGTHHYFMYYNSDPRPETIPEEPRPCLDSGPRNEVVDIRWMPLMDGPGLTLGLPVGEAQLLLPPGFGIPFESMQGYFVTNHHVFNPSPDTLTLTADLKYYYAPAEQITRPLNLMMCEINDIDIPPKTEVTVTGTCTAPVAMDVAILASHTHFYLKKFEQSFFDGERTHDTPFYENTDWDAVRVDVLDEPLHLEPGQGITFSCTFENSSDLTVNVGAGEDGEMCQIHNFYSPVGASAGEKPPYMQATVWRSGGTVAMSPASPSSCGPFGLVPCR